MVRVFLLCNKLCRRVFATNCKRQQRVRRSEGAVVKQMRGEEGEGFGFYFFVGGEGDRVCLGSFERNLSVEK